MDKIKINLLPPEIKEQAKKVAKQSLINRISIGFLGVLILITSGILAVVIIQGASLNSLNSNIEQEKNRLGSLRENEAVVKLLKDRIDTINQFEKNTYKQGDIYNLIVKMVPQGVNANILKINKTPKIVMQGDTDNTRSLQNLLDNIVDPKQNEGKVTSVTVESMNKNSSGKISFELSINLAEGVL